MFKNTKKDQEDQDLILKSPENRNLSIDYELHEQTTKRILTLDEFIQFKNKIPLSNITFRDVDGLSVKDIQEIHWIDILGRINNIDDYVGDSWSRIPIPKDCFGTCINPWGYHLYRNVHLNYDGFVTEKMNVLCSECLEHQEKRIRLKNWFLFGLLYSPII